ncbi:MAG: DNA primase [Planctomycetota bacterium]|nr:DNA primase [Planctomycetota bacterium]
MSQASATDTKEQVRQATDIVELIGTSLTLRREGRQYKGLCPWHDDSRPSLQVNPDRQSWKCWVCDIGGDVFSFVMKRDGLSFPEALELLADRAGIAHRRSGSGQHQTNKKRLFDVAKWAETLFHRTLLNDQMAAPARDYLAQRAISEETIDQFHLGFSPNDWSWLVRKAQQHSIDTKDLVTLGLLGISQKTGKPYDRFKGRVLFSIRDPQGRPIATGGRILPEYSDESPAKYINSPETPLFSKSHSLYALDSAKDNRPSQGEPRSIIVTEGYTDCIIAHQYGFKNCVACLGTALNQDHVQLLSRYADRVILVLDGDQAGHAAADRALGHFLSGGLDLRILTLPDNLDPCDFLQQFGHDAFDLQLKEAPDAIEHKIRMLTGGSMPEVGSHQAAEALEQIIATIAQAPSLRKGGDSENKLREDSTLSRISREFAVPESSVRSRLMELRAARENRATSFESRSPAPAGNSAVTIGDAWEQELLEILIQEPEAVLKSAESIPPTALDDAIARHIYETAISFAQQGLTPDFSCLITAYDDPAMKHILVTLDERGRERGGSDLVKQLPDVLASLHGRKTKHRQQHLAAAIKGKQLGEEEKLEALTEILAQEKKRHQAPPE